MGAGPEDLGDGMSGPGEAHDGGGMASRRGTRRGPRMVKKTVGMAEEDARVGAWLAAMQKAEDLDSEETCARKATEEEVFFRPRPTPWQM